MVLWWPQQSRGTVTFATQRPDLKEPSDIQSKPREPHTQLTLVSYVIMSNFINTVTTSQPFKDKMKHM